MTFIDPFPASLLHLFISCFICEQHSSYLCNICDRELTFSHLVEACESSPIPCPHPSSLTCDSLTMETFSPRVRGGLELREKKKKKSNYSLLPLSCHFWKLTSAQSAPHSLCCFAGLVFDCQQTWKDDRRNGRKTNPCV